MSYIKNERYQDLPIENENKRIGELFEALLSPPSKQSPRNTFSNASSNSNIIHISTSNSSIGSSGSAGSGGAGDLIIKNFTKVSEIVGVLRDENVSAICKVKILDRFIEIFLHSSSNIMNMILFNNNQIQSVTSSGNQISLEMVKKSSSNYNNTIYSNKSLVILTDLLEFLTNDQLNDNDSDLILKTLHLIEILGRQHISLKQLKYLFQLFQSDCKLNVERFLPNLLKSIDSMTFRKSPAAVFYFNGSNAGLIVDSIGKIPNNAYTISLWINIESFVNVINDGRVYEPRLFSFLNENGSGVECYFEDSNLTIRVNSSLKTQVHLEEGFPRNTWVHLAITQAKRWTINPISTLMSGDASELKVYIDGKPVHSCQIKYPSSKPLNLCSIASVHSSLTPSTSSSSRLMSENSCLKCQLGSFTMLDTALSHDDIIDTFKKGSNHVMKKKKTLPVIFSFSPRTFHNNVCYGMPDPGVNAFGIGDLRIYATFSVRDSVYLAGGPALTLPLLQMLAEPHPAHKVLPKMSTVLLFIAHLLLNDSGNQEEFIKCNGVEMVALLMERAFASGSYDDDSDAIVMALDELIQAAPMHVEVRLSGTSQSSNAKIPASTNIRLGVYKDILFNFKIWVHTSKEFQISLYKFLIFKATTSTQYIREHIKVRWILDNIRFFYNNSTSSHPSPSSLSLPTYKDRKEVIGCLFDIIDLLIKHSVLNNDQREIPEIHDIVQFIQDSSCDADIILVEALSILLKYLYADNPRPVITSFESLGEARSLLNLLKRNSDEVQALVIKILGRYLSSSLKKIARSKFSLDDIFPFITDSLREFPMTDLIYRAMCEVIIDDVSMSLTAMSTSPLLDLVGALSSLPAAAISQVRLSIKAVQTLLTLTSRATSSLQQQVLNEVLLVLKHLPSLRASFAEMEGWQHWLLALWPQPSSTTSSPFWSPPLSPMSMVSQINIPPLESSSTSVSPLKTSQPIYNSSGSVVSDRASQSGIKEIITNMIKIILYDCLNKKDGWKIVEETDAWISSLLSNGEPLERRIFFECLSFFERELKSGFTNLSSISNNCNTAQQQVQHQQFAIQQEIIILLKNYVNIMSIIEDFVFSHTMNMLTHRNTQAQWEDFSLVSKLLDVFDITQSIITQKIPVPLQTPPLNQSTSQAQPSSNSGGSSPILIHMSSNTVSPYIIALSSNSNSPCQSPIQEQQKTATPQFQEKSHKELFSFFELPNIDINSSNNNTRPRNTIHTIFRYALCIFQEAESCFFGENHDLGDDDTDSKENSRSSKSMTIKVWGLPLINEDLDQIISKNSIRIQTILASEKDQKEQVKHVMWILCHLITIIRSFDGTCSNNNTILNTQSIIISLVKSLLKAYGDVVDQYIIPPSLLQPLADTISKTIGLTSSTTNQNPQSQFNVHSILSLNESDQNHKEFMKYFRERLLSKRPLLDSLHEVKDFYENSHLSSISILTRRSKVIESIKTSYQKSQENVLLTVQRLHIKTINASQKLELSELQHRTDFESKLARDRSFWECAVAKLFREITKSNGPWYMMDKGYKEKTILKLYHIQNSQRMSLLLKRDYYGSDHPDASISYQSSSSSSPIVSGTSLKTTDHQVLRKLVNPALRQSTSGVHFEDDGISSVINSSELVGFEIEEASLKENTVIIEDVYESSDWCVVDEGVSQSSSSSQNTSSSSFRINTTSITQQINSIKQNKLQQISHSTSTNTSASNSSSSNFSNLISTSTPHSTSHHSQNPLFTTYSEIIRPMLIIRASFIIHHDYISLVPNVIQEDTSIPEKLLKPSSFEIKKIIGVHNRRYLLLPTALEFFFNDKTSLLVNFPQTSIVAQIIKHVAQLSGHISIIFKSMNTVTPSIDSTPYDSILKFLNPTQRWKKREISNFEYLMTLNTIAGRTYNDLNQYPVFPWVITDYTSSTIDLNNPLIYRNLRKPIGALNPTRLELFIERMSQCPPDIPKFMYGTHYSSSGSVMFFLMRTEPFTSDFIKLQSGHFDHADRMFDSIIDCWRNCLNSSSDVKELTPEFYYQPDFLINTNKVDFGTKQNGKMMDDVVLPPWAKSPYHFIMMNRLALESEYVSQNLNHWIDLIFGYKQKGEEAVAANNLFYYLTYENMIDISKLSDPILREATRVQINNFGVTPSQLFTSAHPSRDPPKSQSITRLSLLKRLKPMLMAQLSFSPLIMFFYPAVSTSHQGNSNSNNSSSGIVSPNSPSSYLNMLNSNLSNNALSSLDKVMVLGELNEIQIFKYSDGGSGLHHPTLTPISGKELNFTLSISQQLKSRIGKPFYQIPGNYRAILASGKSDHSLNLIYNDSKIAVGTIHHKAPITTIVYDDNLVGKCGVGGILIERKYIATGSEDSTVILWSLSIDNNQQNYSLHPIHILRGHNYGITCIQLSVDHDICLSASKDGEILLHTISTGKFIRSINHPNNLPIHSMLLCEDGSFFIYSNSIAPIVENFPIKSNNNNNLNISSIQLEDEVEDLSNEITPGEEKMNEQDYYAQMNILYRYSVNGKLIQSILNDVQPVIVKMVVTKLNTGIGSNFLLSAGGYQIVVRELVNLEIAHVFDIRDISSFSNSNRIVDMYLSNLSDTDNSSTAITLMVLLESCQLIVFTIDEFGNLKNLSQ